MATNFTKKTAAIALAAGLAFSGSAGAVFAPVASAQSLTDINKAKVCIKIHKKVGAKTHGNPNPAPQWRTLMVSRWRVQSSPCAS